MLFRSKTSDILISMSLTSYQRKENGVTQFKVKELIKISEVFKIDIKEFFFTNEIPKWDKEKI